MSKVGEATCLASCAGLKFITNIGAAVERWSGVMNDIPPGGCWNHVKSFLSACLTVSPFIFATVVLTLRANPGLRPYLLLNCTVGYFRVYLDLVVVRVRLPKALVLLLYDLKFEEDVKGLRLLRE